MEIEFNIPLNKEDLLASDSGDGYRVREIYEPLMLDDKLQESKAAFRSDGATAIMSYFDTYYSILHHLSRLKDEIKATAWTQILSNSIVHFNSLPMILDPEGIDQQTRLNQLCTLKMEVYILTQFMEAFENDAMKPTTNTDILSKKNKSKKKVSESWDWGAERTRGLSTINQLLQLDIQRLWDPPIVEDELINLVSGVCYKFLENPQITRQKDDREAIIQILGQLIKRYNHQLGATLRIIQLLQHFEHLVIPLAHALEVFVNTFGCKNIVGDLLREIGRMDGGELSRDTSGTRSFSQFIVEISDKIPSYVLPNISLLMAHLDGDSYPMRNGVLGVFSEIIIKVLSKEDLDENMKKSRESFLDKLEDHIHDVHAFVRSKVIQLWIHLSEEKGIPISRQSRVVDLIIGRLHDKSVQVRKNAVLFLKTSLIGNPFAAKLPLEQLVSSLEKETEKLKELQPIEEEENGGSMPKSIYSDEWISMEKDIKEFIIQYFSHGTMEEDNEEEVEFYEDDDEVVEKTILATQKFVKEKSFKKAVELLQVALNKIDDCEEFEITPAEEDEIKFDKETSEEEHQVLEEENEEATPDVEKIQEEKEQKQLFILLRRFFHVKPSTNENEVMDIDLEEATQQATQQPEPNSADLLKNIEIEKQKVLVNYLMDCVKFSQQMKRTVPILCQLLQSKVNSDILETIGFFIAAHEFGLAQSEEGIRRMANLIWSRDPVVKKAVVNAFERLYIEVQCDGLRNKANMIVGALMSLINEANLGELTSLEELLCELMKTKLIPQEVIQLLWQKFALKIPKTTFDEQRMSIIIIAMVAGAEKEIIKSNLSVLVEHGLTVTDNGDLSLARDTCTAILKLTVNKKGFPSSSAEPFRLPTDHQLFIGLENILVKEFLKLNSSSWTPFCEVAISVIYHLAESPDTICSGIMKSLTKSLLEQNDKENNENQEVPEDIEKMNVSAAANAADEIFPKSTAIESLLENVNSRIVARLLSISGHVALLQLFHLDVSIFSELKRRHRIREEEKEKKGQKSKKTPSSKHIRDSTASSVTSNKNQESVLDDDMGVGGAVAEDAEAEYIRRICEIELISGENLLSIYAPLSVIVCSNPAKFKSIELQTAAALSLSKYMIISSEFCDQHLQLLFTILEKSEHPAIRSNTIIALGDLTFRFPNLIEPWTPHLYARLRDDSVDVRKTTVTILTHLILNDMVKVKGQISEMAACLEDKEEKISSAAKMFFFELAQKGNALYNVAPDIISRLSDPDTGVDEKTFRTILKYLLQFIQKDKQAESLVEKLCHRFRATRTERQWRDLSYCLSVLPYNEKAFKKLMENIRCYHDKLTDDEVFNCFTSIIIKSKKFAKIELKTLVDEFEVTLQGYHNKGLEENADFDKAAKALSLAASQSNTRNTGNKTNRKKLQSTRQKKSKADDSDESDTEDIETKENKTPLPGKGKRKTLRTNKKTVKLNAVFSSDDEDIFA